MNIRTLASSLGAVVVVAALGGAATSTAALPPNHYKCYKTMPLVRFTPRSVTLTDQFGTTNTSVLRPSSLCNPADKNGEGIPDPTAHLMCYTARDAGSFVHRTVVARNQFGDQTLTLVKAESLCVPAEKNGVPFGSAGGAFLDHFKCYRARGSLRTAVTVADQFETQPTTLVKPRLFCNPVDKNGEGIPDPDTHLTCYTIKPGAPFAPQTVTVMDQFAQQDLRSLRGECRKRALLCVPSEKNPGGSTTTSTTVPTTTSTSSSTTSSTSSSTTSSTSIPTTTSTSSSTTSSTSTSTSSSTTSSTVAACCGPERIGLVSSAGTLRVDNLAPFPFPSGVITTMDSQATDTGFPVCHHPVLVPLGGFNVPHFDIPALNYCSEITSLGCQTGGTTGKGNLWDGVGTTVSSSDVNKQADTSDGFCDTSFTGANCTTVAGGAGANTLGKIVTTHPGGSLGGVRSALDVPVRSRTWSDSICSPATNPGCCVTSNYGDDTLGNGELLVTLFDFIISPTTDNATGAFVDLNADGCFRAGSGFNTPGPNGPKTLIGVKAAGPCCSVGQVTNVVSVGSGFSGGAPLFDLGFQSTIPNTIATCGTPAPGSCVLTTNPCLGSPSGAFLDTLE